MLRFYSIILLCGLYSASLAQPTKYFQQEVNYKINVSLNDKEHSLSANESILYHNNSPDTLRELWFHIWPNAYRNRNTALVKQQLLSNDVALYFAADSNRGYIDSLDFRTEGIALNWKFDATNIEICRIQLNSPLFPGDSVNITTPFFVKIPNAKYSRLGHIGQAYAITQWYPKPAVYDKDGWHPLPYLDQGEFYSEYGSYDVRITLPSNYVVGSTGDLINGDAELAWMTKKSEEAIEISQVRDMRFPASSSSTKTLHYFQKNIHDFGWFADKRYHVRKSAVTLPNTQQEITTWALFTNNEATLWLKATDYINDALLNYSKWIGDYPYKQCTAVDGTIAAGGGMEYPNVTIIGTSNNAHSFETTVFHEVGHNWFYGLLGFNERDHPWMDEGINSYYEMRLTMQNYPATPTNNYNDLFILGAIGKFLHGDEIDYRRGCRTSYLFTAGSNNDQALSLAAPEYTSLNYGTIIYRKTVSAMFYLSQYLGQEKFDNCMQQYYREWVYRHSGPKEMQTVFEKVSGENLNWFFNDVLTTTKKQDIKVECVKNLGDSITVKIKSKHNALWPVPIATIKNDSVSSIQWFPIKEKYTSLTVPCFSCDKVVVDLEEATLDVNYLNNSSRTKGVLRKASPLELKFGAGFNTHPTSQLFILPALAWNNYNKLMAGIVVHNTFLPQRKFEFTLAPMYGFGDKQLAGAASFDYHIQPVSDLIRQITFSGSVRRFAFSSDNYKDITMSLVPFNYHYLRISPSLRFDIKNKPFNVPVNQYITLSTVHLFKEEVNYFRTANDVAYGKIADKKYSFYRIGYTYANNRRLEPFSLKVKFEGGKDLAKTDVTFRYRIAYKRINKGVDFRLFAGMVFMDAGTGNYNYSLSDRSTASGSTDYAFDDYYFGRIETEGFLSKQMYLRDGAFKSINVLGSYKEAISSLNIKADLPGKLPLSLFADIGVYKDLKSNLLSIYGLNQSFTYDGGVCISVANDLLAIYVPLLRSPEIKKYEATNNLKLKDQIRFVFDIAKFNPLNLRKLLLQ